MRCVNSIFTLTMTPKLSTIGLLVGEHKKT